MTVKVFEPSYLNSFEASLCYTEDGKGSMRAGRFYFTGGRYEWFSSDWLIVCETPYASFYTNIPRERRILFTMEPPEIRQYEKFMYYLEQFGIVIARSEIPGYSGKIIISNPHLGWSTGIHGQFRTSKELEDYQPPDKSKIISIITSLKHKTQYHKKRVEFLRIIQKEFAGILDSYGRDFNPVNDKLDAIAPYKYHVVIENSRINYYWTEKLVDAWFGWSLPIYCGDPEILSQVPDKNGIIIIDVDDVKGSIRTIHEVIESDIYSSRLEAIKTCREWALKNSNRYELACEIIENSNDETPKLAKPELFKILVSKRKNFVYKILSAVSPKLADKIFMTYCKFNGRFWE